MSSLSGDWICQSQAKSSTIKTEDDNACSVFFLLSIAEISRRFSVQV
ncbi:hypothetical protein BGLA2_970005 [Burkholderia gladioli]|nr:hypothetical protein BGLA2_970005 [Burkholderia gladioli]